MVLGQKQTPEQIAQLLWLIEAEVRTTCFFFRLLIGRE